MKWQRRRLLNFATVLSSVIGLAVFAAMLLSIFLQLHFEVRHWPQGRRDLTRSTTWELAAIRGSGWMQQMDFQPERHLAGRESGELQLPFSNYWLRFHVSAEPAPRFEAWNRSYVGNFPFVTASGSAITITRTVFPLWPFVLAIVLASLPLPAIWVLRRRRRIRWEHEGMCPNCGYDLRATPETCPECGAVPAVASESATQP